MKSVGQGNRTSALDTHVFLNVGRRQVDVRRINGITTAITTPDPSCSSRQSVASPMNGSIRSDGMHRQTKKDKKSASRVPFCLTSQKSQKRTNTSGDDFESVAVVNGQTGLVAAKVARRIGIRVMQVGQVLDASQLRSRFQLILQHCQHTRRQSFMKHHHPRSQRLKGQRQSNDQYLCFLIGCGRL